MLEVLQYIFSNFWIWLGFTIIISVIMYALKNLVLAALTIICGIRKNKTN